MRTSRAANHAFSLLELIAVILIIGIVAAFVTPAASTILRGSQLTQATQVLTDQIVLARQLALTKNCSVEVRFIRFTDPEIPNDLGPDGQPGAYRAIQCFEILDNGAKVPMDKPQLLPQSVVMNSGALSSLLNSNPNPPVGPDTQKDPELPRGVKHNYTFVTFRFSPDGSTNLSAIGGAVWFVTLHNLNDTPTGSSPPSNFFTLQIDPVSGTTKSYRPGV